MGAIVLLMQHTKRLNWAYNNKMPLMYACM